MARILRSQGVKPAHYRPSSWAAFTKATWGECAAADCFTTEVWTPRGLGTFHTLSVINPATRRVEIAGTTPTPDDSFMLQVARDLPDDSEDFLRRHRVLNIDRDAKSSSAFRDRLASGAVEAVRIPTRAPDDVVGH